MPLFLVSTPIGNLGDLTARAIETLKNADVIAAEDTRHTGSLLARLGVTARMVSYHDHNEGKRAAELLPLLEAGRNVAVVSDAGTPGVADPAFDLVRAAVERDIPVVPVPGPSAVLAALCASGLPTDRFVFENYLPVKPGKRARKLESFKAEARTVIFYESPFRLVRTLNDMKSVFGDIHAVVAREMTKKFETFHRGPVSALIAHFEEHGVKGEITVLFNLRIAPEGGVPEPDEEA